MGHYLLLIFGLVVTLMTRHVLSQVVEFNTFEQKRTYTQATFSVVSGRNASGHWNSKLHFSHAANTGILEEGNETNAWRMDFDQKVETSEDGEKVHLYATVVIPPERSSGISTVSGEASSAFADHGNGEELLAHGYQLVDGLGYYKFHVLPLTWYSALKTCYEESTQLAVITSQEEASALRRLFQEYPTIPGAYYDYAAFMGANDLENEGVYITINGVPLQDTGYVHWQEGQPNNYGHGDSPGQDCIALTRQAEYLDVECYIKLPFICERSLEH